MAAGGSDSLVRAANEYFDSLVKSRFIEMFSRYFNSNEVTLADLCTSIESGKSFNCGDSRSGVEPAILKLGALLGGAYNPDENKVVDSNLFRKELEVRTGDVLFSRKNTYELVGTAAYVWDTPPNLMLPDLIFRINLKDDVDPIYFVNLINHPQFRIRVISLAHGAASSMPNISKKELLNLSIPVPPINEQSQFADFVKQVDKSKLIFQQMVSRFDELVKSRFIEMFGHPLESRLSDICHVITDGSHFSPDDSQDSDIPMLSVKDMRENSFDYSACKHVNEETYNELVKNGCEPQINDVLISKDGSYFKYGFVVTDYKRQCLLSSIAIIRPVLDKINPNYLRHYLLSDAVVEYVSSNCISGTALKRVILKEIKKIKVIVPPIELQNQFADFVRQVDKSKSEILEGVKRLKIQ